MVVVRGLGRGEVVYKAYRISVGKDQLVLEKGAGDNYTTM